MMFDNFGRHFGGPRARAGAGGRDVARRAPSRSRAPSRHRSVAQSRSVVMLLHLSSKLEFGVPRRARRRASRPARIWL